MRNNLTPLISSSEITFYFNAGRIRVMAINLACRRKLTKKMKIETKRWMPLSKSTTLGSRRALEPT
jgi:hypothetical protein